MKKYMLVFLLLSMSSAHAMDMQKQKDRVEVAHWYKSLATRIASGIVGVLKDVRNLVIDAHQDNMEIVSIFGQEKLLK